MTSDSVRRSGIRIFRAADAPVLSASGLSGGADYGEQPELATAVGALVEAGGVETRVLVNQSPTEGGFSVTYAFFKADYPLFRHRHETDCLYVVVSGSLQMGSQTLRPGDSFFVAGDAPYGYTAGPDGVEVLEIRKDTESFTTKFAPTPAARLEAARDTARTHADRWRATTTGPMLAANTAD